MRRGAGKPACGARGSRGVELRLARLPFRAGCGFAGRAGLSGASGDACARALVRAFRGERFGGFAKAVGIVAKYGGSITEYEGGGKVHGDIIPLIAIPTTAGTGSEVTAFSVITDHSRNYKLTVFSEKLIPSYAILDANLIMTAPQSVAAACGIDA